MTKTIALIVSAISFFKTPSLAQASSKERLGSLMKFFPAFGSVQSISYFSTLSGVKTPVGTGNEEDERIIGFVKEKIVPLYLRIVPYGAPNYSHFSPARLKDALALARKKMVDPQNYQTMFALTQKIIEHPRFESFEKTYDLLSDVLESMNLKNSELVDILRDKASFAAIFEMNRMDPTAFTSKARPRNIFLSKDAKYVIARAILRLSIASRPSQSTP